MTWTPPDRFPDDADLICRVVTNCGIGRRKAPLYCHVAAEFALGSTFAKALCDRYGFDPDQTVGGQLRATR